MLKVIESSEEGCSMTHTVVWHKKTERCLFNAVDWMTEGFFLLLIFKDTCLLCVQKQRKWKSLKECTSVWQNRNIWKQNVILNTIITNKITLSVINDPSTIKLSQNIRVSLNSLRWLLIFYTITQYHMVRVYNKMFVFQRSSPKTKKNTVWLLESSLKKFVHI